MFTCAAFNWLASPSVTELESRVLDQLARALGLPSVFLSTSAAGGGGVIQGSASEAVLTVMVAARDRILLRIKADQGDDAADTIRSKLVAFVSDQTHSCSLKASMIAGVKIRTVSTDPKTCAMSAQALAEAVRGARESGLVPFFATITLGTTGVCAVDDIAGIAQLASTKDFEEVWLHCDAAYAGAALVCPEYQYLIKGIEHFDSFDMNMHKWLLTNFDASCLFIRERRWLIQALSVTPSYLLNLHTETGSVTDYR